MGHFGRKSKRSLLIFPLLYHSLCLPDFFPQGIVHGSLGNSALEQHRRVALRFGGEDAVYCDRGGETAIPTCAFARFCSGPDSRLG